uniref:Uncharacterized protein n=1 Tax=Desertifilum tharense IPPAS B-1220 TaxID=1781255 RepID=A0ACD5H4W0_9CYAN
MLVKIQSVRGGRAMMLDMLAIAEAIDRVRSNLVRDRAVLEMRN